MVIIEGNTGTDPDPQDDRALAGKNVMDPEGVMMVGVVQAELLLFWWPWWWWCCCCGGMELALVKLEVRIGG